MLDTKTRQSGTEQQGRQFGQHSQQPYKSAHESAITETEITSIQSRPFTASECKTLQDSATNAGWECLNRQHLSDSEQVRAKAIYSQIMKQIAPKASENADQSGQTILNENLIGQTVAQMLMATLGNYEDGLRQFTTTSANATGTGSGTT